MELDTQVGRTAAPGPREAMMTNLPADGGVRRGAAALDGSATPLPRDYHVSDEWAHLWLAVQRFSWSTLVVVPADVGERMLSAARAFAAAGQLYDPQGVHLVDASHATPGAIAGILREAADHVSRGSKAVLVVDSPLANPAAIAIARVVDVAVLAVPLRRARLSRAQQTIESIGQERFIGSIALHDRKKRVHLG